jgi:hypothetical protein
MANEKPRKFTGRVERSHRCVVDVTTHFQSNVGEQPIQFACIAFDHQLHATIGQIFDIAGDSITFRYLLSTKAKPDALDASFVEYLPPFAVLLICHFLETFNCNQYTKGLDSALSTLGFGDSPHQPWALAHGYCRGNRGLVPQRRNGIS